MTLQDPLGILVRKINNLWTIVDNLSQENNVHHLYNLDLSKMALEDHYVKVIYLIQA
jgi:hypothetical protein